MSSPSLLPRGILRPLAFAALLGLSLAIPSSPLHAQEGEKEKPKEKETTDVEKKVRRQRNGAGLRATAWQVRDLQGPSSETALYEGWFAKGLDLHLALENTVGYYRRSEKSSTEKVDSYIVPLFTALKLYPWTRPESRFEPFLEGGAGFSFGVEDRQTTTPGLFGGSSTQNSNNMVLGFGLKVGPGFDWRFGKGFGLTAGGRYQWIRFSNVVGGVRTYQGMGLEFGLIYRFQYE